MIINRASIPVPSNIDRAKSLLRFDVEGDHLAALVRDGRTSAAMRVHPLAIDGSLLRQHFQIGVRIAAVDPGDGVPGTAEPPHSPSPRR